MPNVARAAVFISHSVLDRATSAKLGGVLSAEGFETWVDVENLEPGTPDWQSVIRRTIAEAAAVVVLCSPNVITARFVQSEIVLAESLSRPIIPVWISGERWPDSSPLALLTYQYIDARHDWLEGMSRLISRLRDILSGDSPAFVELSDLKACPLGYVPVIMSRSGERLNAFSWGSFLELYDVLDRPFPSTLMAVGVNPAKFDAFEHMLDAFYTTYLRSRYQPYTYGADWVMAKPGSYVSLLALPWQWLLGKRQRPLGDLFPDYTSRATPFASYGFSGRRGGPTWAVVDEEFDKAAGFFTSNSSIAARAFSRFTKPLMFDLMRTTPRPLDNFDGNLEFEHRLVIADDRFGSSSDSYVYVID